MAATNSKRKAEELVNKTVEVEGDTSTEVQPVKSRRASKPKTKTGCYSCKARRIKCGEERPECFKCVRSGRRCDGFPIYKRVEVEVPIAPRPAPGQVPPAVPYLTSNPNISVSGQKPAPNTRVLALPLVTRSIGSNTPGSRVLKKYQPTSPLTSVKEEDARYISPTLYQPGGLSFNPQEEQYFQVFRTHTATELSGFFNSDFWTRSVLQKSHSEASIRHAVVALGALYKTLEKVIETPPSSPESDVVSYVDSAPSHYNFALQQYGKSLTHLRESLQSSERRSQRTILMSIVLFTCFQSFTGDHKAAISQIQAGLGLLEDRRHKSKHELHQGQDDIVEDELIQMFSRLAVQAKSYDMAFHFPHPYVIQLSPKQREPSSPQSSYATSPAASTSSLDSLIPDEFRTTHEAREALDSLCERIMRLNEQLSSFHPGPNNILPPSVMSAGAGFRTQLQQWASAFEPLLEGRRNRGVTRTERAGINVLKMIQIMTMVLFLMGFSTSEMDFDGFVGQFKEIIDLAKELVVDEELTLAAARCGDQNMCRHIKKNKTNNFQHQFPGMASHGSVGHNGHDSYSHIKASFALDLGIVPPLFVVATKCRDRRLRREAIKLLLSSPRREGMWDSILCGKASEWIMEVEEDGLRPFEAWDSMGVNELVTEDKRVMVKEILFDLQRREATLRCGTRGASDGDLDHRAKETFIYW